MAISPFTAEQVYQRMRAYLEANTPLRGFYRGSIIDGFARVSGWMMDDGFYQLMKVVDLFSLDRIRGTDLDLRAKDFYECPPRRKATYSMGPGVFHRELVEGGPTIDEEIVIDAGHTVVAARTAIEEERQYITTGIAVIPADEWTSNVINVSAINAGPGYDVAASEISGVDPEVDGVIRFENTTNVGGGRDKETDPEFIARIKRWIQALSKATIPALVQAALSVKYEDERITSCTIREEETPGRCVAFLDNGFGNPSDNIMQLAQETIDGIVEKRVDVPGYRAGGVRVTGRRSTVIWMKVEASLSLKNVVGINPLTVAAKARSAVINHISALWSGDDVVYNRLVTAIIASNPNFIKDTTLLINGTEENQAVAMNQIAKVKTSDVQVS